MDQFDLFLFDLDGTLVNTETLHYLSYKQALCTLRGENLETFHFTFEDYCRLAHLDSSSMRHLVESIIKEKALTLTWEMFYRMKENLFLQKLDSDELKMIPGAEELLRTLIERGVNTCIVTHSPSSVLEKLQERFPILASVQHTVTKRDVRNPKPHPESYLKALLHFSYKNPIGFEDSYKGFLSLAQSPITPIFLEGDGYVLEPELSPRPVYKFRDFASINWGVVKPMIYEHGIGEFLEKTISTYQKHIEECKKDFRQPIMLLMSILIPLLKKQQGNLFITGIGKCGHVAKKSVSTWQSMGIACQSVNLQDLFHGDFGVFRSGDTVIYLTNSGNTEELVNCASYVSTHFDVTQIALTFKRVCKVSTVVNYHFSLSSGSITEIGHLNMAPTTTSVLFMIFLDILGVRIAEQQGLTMQRFQLNHPGGELGKLRKTSNSIDHVFVIASGLGTRMLPLTRYIPKILLTLWNKAFVERVVAYWSQHCDKIHIVTNGPFADLVRYYVPDVDVVAFDQLTGTADTIARVVPEHCFGQNILFTWGDVVPSNAIDLGKFSNNVVVTWGAESRYKAQNGSIVLDPAAKGNVIGIYYIKHYRGLLHYQVGQDIVDVFADNFGSFETNEISDMIDIGDLPKYRALLSKGSHPEFKVRFFNSITVTSSGTLLKQATNEQGRTIIAKEIHWYQTVESNYSRIPKVLQYIEGGFEMERLKAIPLYKIFSDLSLEEKGDTLHKLLDYLQELHDCLPPRIVDENMRNHDIDIECYRKIITRLEDVRPIIAHFNPISVVNGLDISDVSLPKMLEHCRQIVCDTASLHYSVIHGDCQFSNTLINPTTGELTFIDPRGYFGESLVYGLPEYDYAKTLYALSGYDHFNNDDEFHIKRMVDGNLEFEMNSADFLWIASISDKLVTPATLALLVIIWLGLAQYSKDNVMKCLCSYYQGLYLYKLFMKKSLLR